MKFEIEIRDMAGQTIYYISGDTRHLEDGVKDAIRFMQEIKETGQLPKKPQIKSIVEEE